MDKLSDQELIILFRQGEDKALGILIKRYLTPVYRFLFRLTHDSSLAEDLTQETFLKTWKNLKRFDVSKSFKAWVFAIARNNCIDNFRKNNASSISHFEKDLLGGDSINSIEDNRPLANDILQNEEIAAYIDEGLKKIPQSARAVILMHDTENLTFQEIADALKEPMNTVKSRYRRGIQLLRKLLTNYEKI
ncbi:MAG: RNA polymerase sigma factor [Patescibacteria group bacterium]